MGLLLSGGGEHGFEFALQGYYFVDFVIYVGLLVYYLRKPLSDFVTARRQRIMAEMDEARRLREEAEAKLADYEQRLANLETEIQGILDEARQAGEDQRGRILNEASKAAQRIREDAKIRLEQEGRRLEHELRLKMIELAVGVAEKAVAERITATHRRDFVAGYITEIESREGVF